jgi:hypothetical protein
MTTLPTLHGQIVDALTTRPHQRQYAAEMLQAIERDFAETRKHAAAETALHTLLDRVLGVRP